MEYLKGSVDIKQKIAIMYEKDTSAIYKILLELEAFSEKDAGLYDCFDEFLIMTKSERYAIRVRGFRLLCKQAKWDTENKIDRVFDEIIIMLNDEKPTAAAQAIQYLGHSVVPYKAALHERIKTALLSINYSQFKADTMRPLIEREARKVIMQIDAYQA